MPLRRVVRAKSFILVSWKSVVVIVAHKQYRMRLYTKSYLKKQHPFTHMSS